MKGMTAMHEDQVIVEDPRIAERHRLLIRADAQTGFARDGLQQIDQRAGRHIPTAVVTRQSST